MALDFCKFKRTGLSCNTINKGERDVKEIYFQLWEQIWFQVLSPVCEKVENQIRSQIRSGNSGIPLAVQTQICKSSRSSTSNL